MFSQDRSVSRAALICAGSVESSTRNRGKPAIWPNVLRNTSGHKLDPPIPSNRMSVNPAFFTSSAKRCNTIEIGDLFFGDIRASPAKSLRRCPSTARHPAATTAVLCPLARQSSRLAFCDRRRQAFVGEFVGHTQLCCSFQPRRAIYRKHRRTA